MSKRQEPGQENWKPGADGPAGLSQRELDHDEPWCFCAPRRK